MSNVELLNPKQHQSIRVFATPSATTGGNIHFVPVVADELRALCTEYPVFFMKDENTGQFGLNALLGFQPGENCFLSPDGWRAHYMPLHLRCQPFKVALKSGDKPHQGAVAIDMASPRIVKDTQQHETVESLFNTQGAPTDYLQHITALLSKLMSGIEATQGFIEQLLTHKLITPRALDIKFPDGEQKRFTGFYSLDEQALQALSGKQLEDFHKKGFLQASHLILASGNNLQSLIDKLAR